MIFSSTHGILTKRKQSWIIKTHPNKFKRIKTIQYRVSDYSGIKLEISDRNLVVKISKCLNIKQNPSKYKWFKKR